MRKQFFGCNRKLEYGEKKRSVLIRLNRSQPCDQLLVAWDVTHLLLKQVAFEKEGPSVWNIACGTLFNQIQRTLIVPGTNH